MKYLANIYRYPIKSSMPVSLPESVVEKRGLKFDRLWGIFDTNQQALTAREFPQILDIKAKVSEEELLICYHDKTIERIPLTISPAESKPVKVFSYDTFSGLIASFYSSMKLSRDKSSQSMVELRVILSGLLINALFFSPHKLLLSTLIVD